MRDNIGFIGRAFMHGMGNPAFLAKEVRRTRRELKRANEAFHETEFMPCGYQDAAGDKCEAMGREHMIFIHAWIIAKYGRPSNKLIKLMKEIIED